MSKEFYVVFQNILICSIFSLISGTGFYFSGHPFLSSVLISFVAIFLILSGLKYILDALYIKKVKEKEIERLTDLSTILECAYCNNPNLVTFYPDENRRIEFQCPKCEKRNLVNIQFLVAQISEPIDVPKIESKPIV